MAALTVEVGNLTLDHVLGTADWSGPVTPLVVALLTANGDDTTPGTEVVGGSYARQVSTFDPASLKQAANNVKLAYPDMPTASVVGVEVYDSSGTPVRVAFGALATPRDFNAGDDGEFDVGELVVQLARG